MNYIEIVSNTVEIIESNLCEQLTLEQLANNFSKTKYHFARIFKAVTGHSVMDYYKKRKLSEVAKNLLESDKSIIEIAFSYGYNSHEAFSRAFKEYFNVTPSHVRKYKIKIDLLDKIVIVERKFKNYKNSILPVFKIIQRDRIEFWGERTSIDFKPETLVKVIVDCVKSFLTKSDSLDAYSFVVFPDSVNGQKLNFGVFTTIEEKFKMNINLEKLVIPTTKYMEIKYSGLMEMNWEEVLFDIDIIECKMGFEHDESIVYFFLEYFTNQNISYGYNIYVPLQL